MVTGHHLPALAEPLVRAGGLHPTLPGALLLAFETIGVGAYGHRRTSEPPFSETVSGE
jgi:hypothetical protein